MSNSRRNFIKQSGLAGMGLAGAWMSSYAGTPEDLDRIKEAAEYTPPQTFNMSGYAAPKLDTVRVGFVGIGNRGFDAVTRMNKIEGVEIKGLCDLRPERVKLANDLVKASGHAPGLYHSDPEAWKTMCASKDIDLIYILTPWALHTPIALFSMNHDKHVCVEVPAGKTLQELWSLVETSEKTRKHCMMVENCCYDFFELTTLNMVRQGFFGEIIHCEGSYIHPLTELLFAKDRFYQMWELNEIVSRKGNLYPTHGLGPLCQVLNINRGDKMDYLVSVSSNDFILGDEAKQLAAKDDFYKSYAGRSFNGNMNTSTIRTNKGKTIMVQFDISSPRPYSRIQLISGTRGIALKYPEPSRYATGHEWLGEAEVKVLQEKYAPEIVKKIGEAARQVGGHGGMDFLMDWRTIDCLRNGLPLDQDVYDAALWSSVSPLSVWSVANRSNSITVPDFTRGAWKKNTPVDISMSKGGTTGVK
ncbi:MAG: Gfo/Idh/MocA family oxidoreductase [Sphingobacteriales bacterium]|nr:Gfo/Idh/MocA family oxidoreductase [Sphingobacteriales bacterium]OJY85633.1 MAG: acetylgalactosaminidase [Sphingobacteriales bacterium 44-15]